MSIAIDRRAPREAGRIARGFRNVIGFVYLLGAPTHVYFALFDPQGYRGMSDWSPPVLDASRVFWESWFLPNARYAGLAVAAGELAIAVLILSRGRAAQLGLAAAAAFHVALASIFGMWVYTLPMIMALAYVATLDFEDGPASRVFEVWSTRRSPVRGMPM